MTQPGSEDDLALQVHRVSAQPQEGGRLNVTIETSRGDIPGVQSGKSRPLRKDRT